MELVDWILHLDKHLNELIGTIGPGWLYAIMFAVVFCETGLVVMPFLPGDSLLFALGALCAIDDAKLSIYTMAPLLIIAAILGDALNYWLGAWIGPRVFTSERSWWLNKAHLTRAQAFYSRYGAKTIVLARFVPIVRTFAPFVAGIGKMNFFRFWIYNVVGAVAWVAIFLLAGYFLGRIELIQKNFFLVTLGIIAVSVVPIALEWWMHRREKKRLQGVTSDQVAGS
ncbi:DedA family protein [Pirellulaceae bacterium SH467]|jgi:membrane-associated protein